MAVVTLDLQLVCSGQTRCSLSAPVNSRSATAHPIAQSTIRLLPCWKNMSASWAQAAPAGPGQVPLPRATPRSFLSSSSWSLLLSVCSCCKRTPRGARATSQRNQGSVTTRSAQLSPILNLLANPTVPHGLWELVNTQTHQLPSLRRRQYQEQSATSFPGSSSWYPSGEFPCLWEVHTLFKCDWNVAGAVSEGEDGVVPS